jgi:hypothetical protein
MDWTYNLDVELRLSVQLMLDRGDYEINAHGIWGKGKLRKMQL